MILLILVLVLIPVQVYCQENCTDYEKYYLPRKIFDIAADSAVNIFKNTCDKCDNETVNIDFDILVGNVSKSSSNSINPILRLSSYILIEIEVNFLIYINLYLIHVYIFYRNLLK